MNFSLSGGGTLTVKVVSNTVRIRWDTRVLALPLMGKAGSTNYNIDCPASGTTGTGQIIDADGIPMGANTNVFSALYYQLPTASTSISTLVGNFRVISTLNTVDNIDPSWVLLAVLNTDASQALVKWQAGGVVLPLPDNGQQIQWGSNVQQLGRGATKLSLDGSTATVSASQLIVRHSSGGQIQTLAAVDGGIAEIQFNRKPTGVASAGDLWALGHRSFSGQDGFFSIGCNLTNVTLSISPSGTVNFPYSLTIGGVAVQTSPYISCRINATDPITITNNRGRVTPGVSPTCFPSNAEQQKYQQGTRH